MGSNQALVIVLIIAAVLVLRAVLRQVVVSHVFMPLRLPRAAGPVWARGALLRAWLQAGQPRPYAVLAARLDPKAFTGLPLTLMCLAAAVAAALFSGLIDDLRETEGLVRLDEGVNASLAPFRSPWLIEAFLWITALGAGPAITAVVVTATALMWSQGRTQALAPLWITFAGAQGTTWAGKYAIGRMRPVFLSAVTEASPSFPSGHATASTALIGFLAYAVARDLPDSGQRFEVIFWAAMIVALICFSRMFLSLHYLSDIAAGVLVGAFWLLVGFTLAELKRGVST